MNLLDSGGGSGIITLKYHYFVLIRPIADSCLSLLKVLYLIVTREWVKLQ